MPDSAALSVLIVDDVPIIRDMVKLNLVSRENIHIAGEAVNGQEAVYMADATHPDIVLMDIEMPIMNGIEAAKIIHQKHKNIKVIMLTASSNETQIFQSFAAGAEGYILKERFLETAEMAIKTVRLGAVWLDPGIGRCILEAASTRCKRDNEANIGELLTVEERATLNEVASCSGDTCLVDPAFVAKLRRLGQTRVN